MRCARIYFLFPLFIFLYKCGLPQKKSSTETSTNKYLALGDSYTIGESVCDGCSYPLQLQDSLNEISEEKTSVKIIAQTGWTTSDLISAISSEKIATDYDLVTLLIGVNNQYQGKKIELFEKEFAILLERAIGFANGKSKNVIVLSIPDYAYTPFGKSSGNAADITADLESYNAIIKRISKEKGVYFINITSITKEGLTNPDLVATDGLHPSEKAYKRFVKEIYGKAFEIIY